MCVTVMSGVVLLDGNSDSPASGRSHKEKAAGGAGWRAGRCASGTSGVRATFRLSRVDNPVRSWRGMSGNELIWPVCVKAVQVVACSPEEKEW